MHSPPDTSLRWLEPSHMLYRMSPQIGHSARPDHYRNARLVPSRDGSFDSGHFFELDPPRSRSVTSRRNREFSSSSSAIWSPAPHVRSGSLATTRRARRSRDRPGRSGGGLNSGSGFVLLFLFRAVGWASVVATRWFHSYLVMRARIQGFRVKSITSLHIVVQPAFSGWDIRPPSCVSE